MAKTEDLLAVGTEVDNMRTHGKGYTLRLRVHFVEFSFAVRAHRRKIVPFDYREWSVTHL